MLMFIIGSSLLGASIALAQPKTTLGLRSVQVPPPLNSPVFSLATLSADGSTDMNILTYLTPVGIRPSRTWVASLYRSTLSYSNFKARGTGVLQLLREKHADLVYPLGGMSGRDVDKPAMCSEKGFAWVDAGEALELSAESCGENEDITGPLLLPGCAAYYHVSLVGKSAESDGSEVNLLNAGDHEVVFLSLDAVYEEDEEMAAVDGEKQMSTAFLRDLGIVSDVGRAIPPSE